MLSCVGYYSAKSVDYFEKQVVPPYRLIITNEVLQVRPTSLQLLSAAVSWLQLFVDIDRIAWRNVWTCANSALSALKLREDEIEQTSLKPPFFNEGRMYSCRSEFTLTIRLSGGGRASGEIRAMRRRVTCQEWTQSSGRRAAGASLERAAAQHHAADAPCSC